MSLDLSPVVQPLARWARRFSHNWRGRRKTSAEDNLPDTRTHRSAEELPRTTTQPQAVDGPSPSFRLDPSLAKNVFGRGENHVGESGSSQFRSHPIDRRTVEAAVDDVAVEEAGPPEAAVGATNQADLLTSTRDDGGEVQPSGPGERSVPEPLVKTMIEVLPSKGPSPKSRGSYLAESLGEIFEKKVVVDPRVKSLLRGRETVDIHQLARELRDFAKSLGL